MVGGSAGRDATRRDGQNPAFTYTKHVREHAKVSVPALGWQLTDNGLASFLDMTEGARGVGNVCKKTGANNGNGWTAPPRWCSGDL